MNRASALRLAFFAGLAILATTTTPVRAAPVTLQFAIDNYTDFDHALVVGDKRFWDFTYLATGDMPIAEFVNVDGFVDTARDLWCLHFQGGFIDTDFDGASDALIIYKAFAPPGFSDVHLETDLAVAGSGVGSVTEQVRDVSGNLLGTIVATNTNPLPDPLVFPVGQCPEFLQISKDIALLATPGLGGLVTVSNINQCYSQCPEPSTIMASLMGIVMSVGACRLRRRKG